MRVWVSSLILVFASAVAARADLCPAPAHVCCAPDQPLGPPCASEAFEPCRAAEMTFGGEALPSPLRGLSDCLSSTVDRPQPKVSLPAPPRGDLLCLSGVLTLGGLNLLRRARPAQWHLPDWYHDSDHLTSARWTPWTPDRATPSWVHCKLTGESDRVGWPANPVEPLPPARQESCRAQTHPRAPPA